MARGDTAARQVRLVLMLLDSRELNVERAAEETGCTPRTIYRDLEVLERVGVPLYQEKHGKRVRWRLVDGFNQRLSIQLTVQEAMALVAAERLLAGMEGSMFDHAARNAMAKVKHALVPEIRRRVEALVGHLTTSSAPSRRLGHHREHLHMLLEAVAETRLIDLVYRKLEAIAAKQYTVEPHHVHVQGTGIYLVGFVRESARVRVFLLDRVVSVDVSDEVFPRRPEIGPELFAQGSFGLWDAPNENIQLKFLGSAAQIVAEQQFHPTQAVERHEDGSIVISFQMPVSPAVRQWVRGFGKRVRVLTPLSLLNEG